MSPTHKEQYNSLVVDGLKLFGLSNFHRNYTLKEFTNYFLYPLSHKKIRFFYEGKVPIGLVTWCFLSNEKSEAFFKDEYVIQEEDYRANEGDKLWCIEFIAPFGDALKVARECNNISETFTQVNTKQVGNDLGDKNNMGKDIFN